jgi:hypothetical protein
MWRKEVSSDLSRVLRRATPGHPAKPRKSLLRTYVVAGERTRWRVMTIIMAQQM